MISILIFFSAESSGLPRRKYIFWRVQIACALLFHIFIHLNKVSWLEMIFQKLYLRAHWPVEYHWAKTTGDHWCKLFIIADEALRCIRMSRGQPLQQFQPGAPKNIGSRSPHDKHLEFLFNAVSPRLPRRKNIP